MRFRNCICQHHFREDFVLGSGELKMDRLIEHLNTIFEVSVCLTKSLLIKLASNRFVISLPSRYEQSVLILPSDFKPQNLHSGESFTTSEG